jgi:hypothetical protein
MILGIISVIVGAIIFIVNLAKEVDTVQQQTVQYLGFIWGSLFVIGGFIMITVQNCLSGKTGKETPRETETKKVTWNCPKCNEEVPNYSYTCQKCGYELK